VDLRASLDELEKKFLILPGNNSDPLVVQLIARCTDWYFGFLYVHKN
jgi:hypothetical protein